jgi:polysaccharide biosynthesis/export protein
VTAPLPKEAALHRRIPGIAAAFGLAATLAAAPPALAGSKTPVSTDLPPPDPAYASLDVAKNYRIGPLDKLDINVFQVDELKTEVQVDASGNITLPLLGDLVAAGKTTTELAAEIAGRLDAKYLKSPQVTVMVKEAESQKVTVGGAVIQPGVYEIKGHTTLLQAVALARGADRVADLKHVTVFRQVNGQRYVATVDMRQIQNGKVADPEIYGDDLVMVGTSGFKSTLREVTGVAPLLSFVPLIR